MQDTQHMTPAKRVLYLLVGPLCLLISFTAFFMMLPRETPYWLVSLILSTLIGLYITKLGADEAAENLPPPEVVQVEVEKVRVEEKVRIEIPDQVQQELTALREEQEELNKQLAQIKRSESKAQEKLGEVLQQSERQTREKTSLSQTIEELNRKLAQGQEEIFNVKANIKRIPELEQNLKRIPELEKIAQRVPELEELNKKLEQRIPELEKIAQSVPELEELNRKLEKRIPELEKIAQRVPELEKIAASIPEFEKQLQEKSQPDAEARRWQGLYNQLRQQFEEKCSILDATRRQLFTSQEQIERFQREDQERALCDRSPFEKELEAQCASLEFELQEKTARYESEIASLEALVNL